MSASGNIPETQHGDGRECSSSKTTTEDVELTAHTSAAASSKTNESYTTTPIGSRRNKWGRIRIRPIRLFK